jgi:hypothetical protein
VITNEGATEAWIAYLKAQTPITSLLNSSLQIKELEYQGDGFVYPGIRVSLDYMPGEDNCFPDSMTVYLDTFSEQKSSKEAVHITATVLNVLRNISSFTQNNVKFFMIHVRKISRPDRIESGAWQSTLEIDAKASG